MSGVASSIWVRVQTEAAGLLELDLPAELCLEVEGGALGGC